MSGKEFMTSLRVTLVAADRSMGDRFVASVRKEGTEDPLQLEALLDAETFVVKHELGQVADPAPMPVYATLSVCMPAPGAATRLRAGSSPHPVVTKRRALSALASTSALLVLLDETVSPVGSYACDDLLSTIRVTLSLRGTAVVVSLLLYAEPSDALQRALRSVEQDFGVAIPVELWSPSATDLQETLFRTVDRAEAHAAPKRVVRSRQPVRFVVERGTTNHRNDFVCRVISGTLSVDDVLSSPASDQRLFTICSIKSLHGVKLPRAEVDQTVVLRVCRADNASVKPGMIFGPATLQLPPAAGPTLDRMAQFAEPVASIFCGLITVPKGVALDPARPLTLASFGSDALVSLSVWSLNAAEAVAAAAQDAGVDTSHLDVIAFAAVHGAERSVVADPFVGLSVALLQQHQKRNGFDPVVAGTVVGAWHTGRFRSVVQTAFHLNTLDGCDYDDSVTLLQRLAKPLPEPFVGAFLAEALPMQTVAKALLGAQTRTLPLSYDQAVLSEIAAPIMLPLQREAWSANFGSRSAPRNTALSSPLTVLLRAPSVPYNIKLHVISLIRDSVVLDLGTYQPSTIESNTPEMRAVCAIVQPQDMSVAMLSGLSIPLSTVAMETIKGTGFRMLARILQLRERPGFISPGAIRGLNELLTPKAIGNSVTADPHFSVPSMDFFIKALASVSTHQWNLVPGVPRLVRLLAKRGGFHAGLVADNEPAPLVAWTHTTAKTLRCSVLLPASIVARVLEYVLPRPALSKRS